MSDDRAGTIAQMIAFVLTPAGVTFTLALLGFAGAVGTSAYSIGKDVGDRSAAAYRAATEMDLTGLLKSAAQATVDLKKVSSDFSDMVATNETYLALKKAFNKLESENQGLRQDGREKADMLNRTQAQLRKAQGDLAAITMSDTRHELAAGRAVLAGGGLLNIGLIESSTQSALLNVNGKHLQSFAGDDLPISIDTTKCLIRVHEVSADRANISAQCKPNPLLVKPDLTVNRDELMAAIEAVRLAPFARVKDALRAPAGQAASP